MVRQHHMPTDTASKLSDVQLLVRANSLASIATLVSVAMWLASIQQIGAPPAIAAAIALCCGLFGVVFAVWLAIRDSQPRLVLLGLWALAPLLWISYFLLVLQPSAIGR